MNNLIGIIEQFRNKNIMVIGDIMLDKYIWGDVSRISPEAPVQIVNVAKESYAPGGAANVASNIAALNAKVYIVGIAGKEDTKDKLISELKKRNVCISGVFTDSNKPTIQKVRVIGRSRQLLRFDYESKGCIDSKTEDNIFGFVKKKIREINAVVVSDYAKGVITKSLMEKIIGICNKENKIIVVDPKPGHKEFYKNVTLVTPNHKEAYEMTGFVEEEPSYAPQSHLDFSGTKRSDIESIGKQLLAELNSTILITKGEKGMSLFEKDGKITNIPTFAKEVYDIIGAGDTSVAVLTLALASGASFKESAIIANHAAGITVGKIGTSTVSSEELKGSVENG